MNIIVTSLLTLSLLVAIPGCCKKDRCTAVYIDANNTLQTEELASADSADTSASQNIKC